MSMNISLPSSLYFDFKEHCSYQTTISNVLKIYNVTEMFCYSILELSQKINKK